MKDYITICCRKCGRELALIACREFEVVSCDYSDFSYSKALNEFWIGEYCEECAASLSKYD